MANANHNNNTSHAFAFEVLKSPVFSTRARRALLHTPHGVVETPNFIFCGTKASVKAVPTHRLPGLGCRFILSNTYHLMLRPGGELIAQAGGLHAFMGWGGPLLSDSGGYQIFAMGHGSVAEEVKRRKGSVTSLVAVEEAGAKFRSYVDGKTVFLTPELSMQLQHQFGVDFAVQLDECTAYHISQRATRKAMQRSMRWGDRSLQCFKTLLEKKPSINPSSSCRNAFAKEDSYFLSLARNLQAQLAGARANVALPQQVVGVVQGGVYEKLRRESVDYVYDRPFFSVAIGGSLGQNKQEMFSVVQMTMEMVAKKPPRWVHLLGIGDIVDIFHGVENGIDTFDCVLPTRIARHGHAIVPFAQLAKEEFAEEEVKPGTAVLNLRNARHSQSKLPLDASLHSTSRLHVSPYSNLPLKGANGDGVGKAAGEAVNYSRAYIHYLLKAKELSALAIISEHNIMQMNRLFSELRHAISEGEAQFKALRKYWLGT